MTKYVFTLPGGERVTGAVQKRGGGYLGPGKVGEIRCDLVHAELGLSLVHVAEPERGTALVTDPDRHLARLVPLAGTQVEVQS